MCLIGNIACRWEQQTTKRLRFTYMSAGTDGDWYCDANYVGGIGCPEYDTLESNKHIISGALHSCYWDGNWWQVRFSSIYQMLCDLLHPYSNKSINRRSLYSNRMNLGGRAATRAAAAPTASTRPAARSAPAATSTPTGPSSSHTTRPEDVPVGQSSFISAFYKFHIGASHLLWSTHFFWNGSVKTVCEMFRFAFLHLCSPVQTEQHGNQYIFCFIDRTIWFWYKSALQSTYFLLEIDRNSSFLIIVIYWLSMMMRCQTVRSGVVRN